LSSTPRLIQIIPGRAEHRWLYDAFLHSKLTLAVTNEIIAEYEETLNVFYESSQLGGNVARTLLELPQTRRILVYYNWRLIVADPDDDKYVDCAVASNADYVITHDRHFNVLKQINFPKVNCLSLVQFKKIFEKEK